MRVIRETSYVLSGSGTRFYAFIGALRVLFAAGWFPKRLIGTSGGGLVVLFIAAHYDPANPLAVIDKLEAFARSFRMSEMLDPGGLRWPRFWHGAFKGQRVLKELRRALPRDWRDMKLPVFVVTADRTAKAAKVWGVEDGVEPAIAGRATMSLPVFDAVRINDHWHTDGGTRANYPLSFFGDDAHVVGLRFRPVGADDVIMPGEQGDAVQTFDNKLAFQLDNVDDMIEATSRMHMAAATKARTLMLDAPGSGMDFSIDDEEIEALIQAGEDSARRFLSAA